MFTVDFMKHKIQITKKNSVAFIFCIQAVELMRKRLTMQNKINSGKVKHLMQPWGSQGKKLIFLLGPVMKCLLITHYKFDKMQFNQWKRKIKTCSPNPQVSKFSRSFDTKYSPLHFLLLGQLTVIINVTQMTCTIIVNGKRVNL